MSDLSLSGGAPRTEPEIQGPPEAPQQQAPQLTAGSLGDYIEAQSISQELQAATQSGNWRARNRALQQQRMQAGMASVQALMQGGDPSRETRPIGSMVDPMVEMERRFIHMWQKEQKFAEVMEAEGLEDIKGFMNEVADLYRERNEAKFDANDSTQLEPITVDPNRVADIRQMATKIDQAMKAIDPQASVFTHPKTRKYMEWLNREAQGGGVGYLASGEQELDYGVVGNALTPVRELVEGATEFPINLVEGVWDLADRGARALGGPSLGFPASNYMVGPNGEIWHNGGKTPGFYQRMSMMMAAATGENVNVAAREMGRAQELEVANRNGFQNVVFGASRIAGMGFGFGLPAGASMSIGAKLGGQLTSKGLGYLGSLGMKGTAGAARAKKITRILGGTVGAAAANGAMEAIAFGRHEGFAKSYMHGMALGPVLMGIGAMGRGTERYLRNWKKMPKRLAATVGAGVEGLGFGTLEAAEMGVLWDFLKDPNETTFQTYMKNVVGMMLFKNMGRMPQDTPGQMALDQVLGGRQRQEFAERVARDEVTAEELMRTPAEDLNLLREVGEASQATRRAQTPAEAQQAQQRMRDAESRLDVQELGLENQAQKEVEAFAERGEIPKGEWTQERLDAVSSRYKELQERAKPPEKAPEWTQERVDEIRTRFEGVKERASELSKALGKDAEPWTQDRLREIDAAYKELTENIGRDRSQRGQEWTQEKMAEIDRAYREIYDKARERRVHPQLSREQLIERARERAQKAKTPEARQEAIAEIRRLEGQAEGAKEIAPGLKLEIRESEGQVGASEWLIKNAEGEVIGSGSFQSKGGKADIWGAEIAEQHRGKGLYSKVLQELSARHPEGLDSPGDRSPSAQRAAERAGLDIGEGGLAMPKPGRTGAGQQRRLRTKKEATGEVEEELRAPEMPQSSRDVEIFPTEGREGVEPVRLSDIFSEMEGRPGRAGVRIPFTAKRVGAKPGDPVRTTLRRGRTGGPAGVYRVYENLARTESGLDLITGAHEWSHAMHRKVLGELGQRFGEASEAQMRAAMERDPRIAEEVSRILAEYEGAESLRPGRQWQETWSEWHARNILGDATLDTQYPAISQFMRSWLAEPSQASLRQQYQRIQGMAQRFIDSGGPARVRQVVGEQPRDKGVLESADRLLLDEMAEVIRLEKEVMEKSGIDPADVEITERPSRVYHARNLTANQTANRFIMQGIKTPEGVTVPGLAEVLGSVRGRELDLRDFMIAQRALAEHAKGREVPGGLPPQDYLATVRKYSDMQEPAQRVKDWMDALVDWVAEEGNLSRESAQNIKDAYAFYVPFFRVMEGGRGPGGTRRTAEAGTGIGRAKGSTLEIQDPLVAMQGLAASMINRARQNEVMGALYTFAARHEGGGLATIVPKKNVPSDHPMMEILNAIERGVELPGDRQHEFETLLSSLRDIGELNEQTVTLFTQKTMTAGENNIVAYTPRLTPEEIKRIARDPAHERLLQEQQGKTQWLEVPTEVYNALMAIDKPPSIASVVKNDLLTTLLTGPTKLVRLFATGIRPAFTVASMLRDVMQQPIFSRDGKISPLGGLRKYIQGISLYLNRGGEVRRLYDEAGVSISTLRGRDVERKIAGEHRGMMRRLRDALKSYERFLAAPENFLRIAEFENIRQKALKEGKTERQALLEATEAAREILVNFARGGVAAKMINQMVAYFNPAVQSQRKLIRTLAGMEGQGDLARARAQRAAWINGIVNITVPSMVLAAMFRDEEWYQDLPEWRKLHYWNMKIGDQVVSIPKPYEAGVVFGSIPEMLVDSNPVGLKAAMKAAVFNYMDGPGALIPNIIRPSVEVAFDWNIFHGQRLTPEHIQRHLPEEQYTFSTTEVAKTLSKAFGGIVTPIEIQHWLSSHTAGMSTKLMRAMDDVAGAKEVVGIWELQNPVAPMLKQTKHGSSRAVNEFYPLLKRLNQEARSDTITPERAVLRRQMNRASNRMTAVRKQYRDGQISKEEADRQLFEIVNPLVEEAR